MITEEQIGPRVRQLRIERGLTIAALAEKSGFSRGYLSKMENSSSAPPVSTLMTLARALDVNINEVFSEDETAVGVTLVKKQDRQAISRPGSAFGYSYEPLAPTFPQRRMDPYVLTVRPDAKGTKVFQHKGQELIVALKGSVVMTLGNKDYRLEEGDCLYFNSSLPHAGLVVGNEPAELLIVMCSEE
jgi:transcriptional regulator with XRE-family HTH domain